LSTSQEREEAYEFKRIPLEQLEIGEHNVRKRERAEGLDELAYSMDHFGLQHPIVVQPHNGKYEIIIGQRRFLAAKRLGWRDIDAKVRKGRLSELDSKVISFSENIQRRDISPRDKSDTCVYLLDQLGSPSRVAEHLGTTEQTVRKWLGYAAVPRGLKDLVEQRIITVPVAIRLSEYIHDEEKAIAIAKKMSTEPKRHRDRIMESVEELPDRPISAILKRAEEKKFQKKIIFILPERWSFVMDRAAKRLNASPNDIARDATIEWLQMMHY